MPLPFPIAPGTAVPTQPVAGWIIASTPARPLPASCPTASTGARTGARTDARAGTGAAAWRRCIRQGYAPLAGAGLHPLMVFQPVALPLLRRTGGAHPVTILDPLLLGHELAAEYRFVCLVAVSIPVTVCCLLLRAVALLNRLGADGCREAGAKQCRRCHEPELLSHESLLLGMIACQGRHRQHEHGHGDQRHAVNKGTTQP